MDIGIGRVRDRYKYKSVRKRERDNERETTRETTRERQRERQRERDNERDNERGNERDSERETSRYIYKYYLFNACYGPVVIGEKEVPLSGVNVLLVGVHLGGFNTRGVPEREREIG